jgi:tRNA/tmRNA/rRNA uracil-C5-methylase (TrmA/RlmC/RlmD family)
MNAPDAAVEVDITGLHANGYGVAHLPKLGHVYVPFAFPGQRVSVRLVEEVRSGQWQAELLQPNAAHCSISSRCGGCLWPGVAYTEQLAGKENLFRRALSGLRELASMPAEVHASPAITEYRSRMHLHANFFRGRFSFGFYARGSRDLLPVTDCTVASPALQRAVHELASLRSHPNSPMRMTLVLASSSLILQKQRACCSHSIRALRAAKIFSTSFNPSAALPHGP